MISNGISCFHWRKKSQSSKTGVEQPQSASPYALYIFCHLYLLPGTPILARVPLHDPRDGAQSACLSGTVKNADSNFVHLPEFVCSGKRFLVLRTPQLRASVSGRSGSVGVQTGRVRSVRADADGVGMSS
jgi:hypothetical protein